jgi:hypothetical protein
MQKLLIRLVSRISRCRSLPVHPDGYRLSWWFTKYVDPAFFAYVVVAGGACMGLALAAQIFISLWEMWI